jgi:hypothetical protein
MDTQTLIDKITKAINFAYQSDGTAPGLTVAWLSRARETYYVSIVRWVSGEKEVVCSVHNPDLTVALRELAEKFIVENPLPENPVETLSRYLTDNRASHVSDVGAAVVVSIN